MRNDKNMTRTRQNRTKQNETTASKLSDVRIAAHDQGEVTRSSTRILGEKRASIHIHTLQQQY